MEQFDRSTYLNDLFYIYRPTVCLLKGQYSRDHYLILVQHSWLNGTSCPTNMSWIKWNKYIINNKIRSSYLYICEIMQMYNIIKEGLICFNCLFWVLTHFDVLHTKNCLYSCCLYPCCASINSHYLKLTTYFHDFKNWSWRNEHK